MQGLADLFSRNTHFVPKTQAQALAAFQEGIVDESVFIWKAVNIHPVFEEPWDLDEVERLLSKDDLDLETTILLMTIFERLIRDSDKERALFAAESINAVERRRMKRIQDLREAAEAEPTAELRLRLAREYRDLAMICFARPVLKNFYLGEALAALRTEDGAALGAEKSEEEVGVPARALEIGILVDLGRLDEADALIASALGAFPEDPALRFLAAKTRFERRDYRGTACALSDPLPLENAEFEAIRAFWGGGGGACRG